MDARRTASMLLSLAHSFWRAVVLVLLDGPRARAPCGREEGMGGLAS